MENPKTPQKTNYNVTIQTTEGTICAELYPQYAPKAVENFIQHAKEGYYNGVIFHRVIKDFMIQTGDPTGTGRGGESIYGEPFEDEVTPNLFHQYGAISMANAGPNTNGSQFFIVTNKHVDHSMIKQMEVRQAPEVMIKTYKEKGGTPWLDGRHTIFGQVLEGNDVLDKIESVQTNAMDQPVSPVVIEKIQVEEKSAK